MWVGGGCVSENGKINNKNPKLRRRLYGGGGGGGGGVRKEKRLARRFIIF